MKLTEELLHALGFVDMGNHWVDSYQVVIFKNQLPETLLELKNLLTGTAYNKGKRSSVRSETFVPVTSHTIHYNTARSRYTEAQGNG